jgi:hypothetical protein
MNEKTLTNAEVKEIQEIQVFLEKIALIPFKRAEVKCVLSHISTAEKAFGKKVPDNY